MPKPNDISPKLLSRAMQPQLDFGRGNLAEASLDWGGYLLLTMPEPWQKAEPMLRNQPQYVHCVTSLDRGEAERIAGELPEADTIVGLGGGMSLDLAKYVAWRRDAEPVLVPSLASVDACVTNSIAVREEDRVRYVGFVVPRMVLLDFDLMQSAPARLNRAGVGDILSIHTGRWDWKLGADRGRGRFDPEVDREVAALVDQLEARAASIRDADEAALKWIIEAYVKENALCLQVGHSRPEEGSEHYFAYQVEALTKRSFVHGELVCLGALLMARHQENQPERVEKILAETGVCYQPRDLGLLGAEVEAALDGLGAFVQSEGLAYSVVDHKPISGPVAARLMSGLRF